MRMKFFKSVFVFLITCTMILSVQTSFAGEIDYPIPCAIEFQLDFLELN